MDTKVCTTCHANCVMSDFPLNRAGEHGKTCVRCRAKDKLRNEKRKTYLYEQQKKYYSEHHQQCLDQGKQYRKKHKDDIKEKAKQFRKENKEKCLNQCKKYRNTHKNEMKQYLRQYHQKTKEQRRFKNKIYQRQYRKQQRDTNPLTKLIDNMRRRVNGAVERKTQHTIDYLGCTWKFFENHIKKQFSEGMSWNNYGEWEIDHIIALKWNHPTEQQVAIRLHWTNCQPMWRDDNNQKGNRTPTLEELRKLNKHLDESFDLLEEKINQTTKEFKSIH